MTTSAADANNIPTPYIAVAANYFGTGASALEARKALVHAGGSPQEPQTVFKLPEGATGAFVSVDGNVHWYNADDQVAQPVFRYVNGKAKAWKPGEDKPLPWLPVTASTKPRHAPDAQDKGEIHPEPQLDETADAEPTDDKESTIVTTDLPKKPTRKRPAPKPSKTDDGEVTTFGKQFEVPATESANEEAAAKPKRVRKPKAKPSQMEVTSETVGTSVEEPFIDAAAEIDAIRALPPPVTTPMPMEAGQPFPGSEIPAETLEEARTDPETDDQVVGSADVNGVASEEHANFMLFVGSAFYTRDVFVSEANQLGISRRMPSHRLPKGLVCGKTRVYVAADGARKTDGSPTSEVFAYFIPQRVEFIDSPDGKQYADIVATLKLRPDTKIIGSIKDEAPRACGTRVEGGTYVVVDQGDSPLIMLDKPAHYEGNHFRGMLRLSAEQVALFDSGGTVMTLVDESCMTCGAAMKCAPDGHARAERERKRIDKGQEPKWRLNCGACQAKVRADRRAANEPQADEPQEAAAE